MRLDAMLAGCVVAFMSNENPPPPKKKRAPAGYFDILRWSGLPGFWVYLIGSVVLTAAVAVAARGCWCAWECNSAAMGSGRQHWEGVYGSKRETEVSWFQPEPALSLALIREYAPDRAASVIDVGGGASPLAAELLREGYADLAVLDISAAALERAKANLGGEAAKIEWIIADITEWMPARQWQVWHDRAVFHFLTDTASQDAYIRALHARPNRARSRSFPVSRRTGRRDAASFRSCVTTRLRCRSGSAMPSRCLRRSARSTIRRAVRCRSSITRY